MLEISESGGHKILKSILVSVWGVSLRSVCGVAQDDCSSSVEEAVRQVSECRAASKGRHSHRTSRQLARPLPCQEHLISLLICHEYENIAAGEWPRLIIATGARQYTNMPSKSIPFHILLLAEWCCFSTDQWTTSLFLSFSRGCLTIMPHLKVINMMYIYNIITYMTNTMQSLYHPRCVMSITWVAKNSFDLGREILHCNI